MQGTLNLSLVPLYSLFFIYSYITVIYLLNRNHVLLLNTNIVVCIFNVLLINGFLSFISYDHMLFFVRIKNEVSSMLCTIATI